MGFDLFFCLGVGHSLTWATVNIVTCPGGGGAWLQVVGKQMTGITKMSIITESTSNE